VKARAALWGLSVLLAAVPVSAQNDIARAKTHFSLGARAYEANQFRVAIQAFEEAERLAPHPALLFSIAQASRRQYFIDRKPEDLRRAVVHYRRYIDKAPDGNRRGEAGAALAELEPLAERLGISTAAAGSEAAAAPARRPARLMVAASVKTAVATIDGGPTLTLPNSAEVAPGKRVVRGRADGYYDEERVVEAVVGESIVVDLPMRERPARLDVRTEDGAQIFVDGRVMGVTPLPRPLDIPPGRRFVAVTKTGRSSFSAEVDLVRARSTRIDAPLSTTAQRRVAYGLIGAGVAGVVTGGVLVALAAREQSVAQDIDERAEAGNIAEADRREHAAALAARSDFQRAYAGAFAGGAVVGVTGLLLYMFDASAPNAPPRPRDNAPAPPSGSEPETPSIFLSSGPGSFGGSLSGRF
jgi:hypothetical protein